MLSELNLAIFGGKLTCVSSIVSRRAVEVLEILMFMEERAEERENSSGSTDYSKQRRTDSKDKLSRVSRTILDSAPALFTACLLIVPSQWSRSPSPNRGQRNIRLATAPTRSPKSGKLLFSCWVKFISLHDRLRCCCDILPACRLSCLLPRRARFPLRAPPRRNYSPKRARTAFHSRSDVTAPRDRTFATGGH
jgi:hypothetical protein